MLDDVSRTIVTEAQAAGAAGVDATAALKVIGDGASGALSSGMAISSPAGHDAVARAIAARVGG